MKKPYPLLKYLVYPFVKLYIRKIKGLENLSKEKGYLLASNHSSFLDDLIFSLITIYATDRVIHIFVNNRYNNYYFVRKLLIYGKCIPVYVDKNEKSKELNEKSLKIAGDFLKKGENVGIFPEGTRNIDGQLKKGKNGIARLALMEKVSVVPFGIKGSHKILPKGAFFPRFKRCEVYIGKPINLEEYFGFEENEIYEKITRKIMLKIGDLIGQKYLY